jgi:DNA-3-methyladenine glycosylase
MPKSLPRKAEILASAFFARDAVALAQDLVGATLLVDGIGGVIVETEAFPSPAPWDELFTAEGLSTSPPARG